VTTDPGDRHTSPGWSRWIPVLGTALALIWAVIRIGPRIPYPGSFYISTSWPFPGLDEVQTYARSSPVGYWLAMLLGIEQSHWLILMRVVAAVAAVALVATWVYRETAEGSQRLRGFRLVVLGPLTAILFLTLGSYDAFTVLGLGMALFAWSRGAWPWLLLAGTYLGIQHFEQGLVAVVAWALVLAGMAGQLPERLSSRRTSLWLIPGMLLGKVTLLTLLVANGVSAGEGRSYWLQNSELLKRAVVGAMNFGPALLLSLFAGLWAVVILALTLPADNRRRLLLALGLAVPALSAVITMDHTRVFVITTVPIVAILIVTVLSTREVTSQWRLVLLVEAMAWIVVPINIQGTDVVYVDPMNFLDQWIIFLQNALPG
jgi:hypothetical protein